MHTGNDQHVQQHEVWLQQQQQAAERLEVSPLIVITENVVAFFIICLLIVSILRAIYQAVSNHIPAHEVKIKSTSDKSEVLWLFNIIVIYLSF